jgi:hypothetical protein
VLRARHDERAHAMPATEQAHPAHEAPSVTPLAAHP